VLNAAALTKPHAIDHLAVDLASYKSDVAVITESHFKAKHSDSMLADKDYLLFRRDLTGRRGGGVALYVRSTLQATVWKYSADDHTFELLWVRVGNVFVAAIYHPPKPLYTIEELFNYIEGCVKEVSRLFPAAQIVLAGDTNQLPDNELAVRTGLSQIVHQPTRGVNILDRIYVSCPLLFKTVRVVVSLVKSDHKAVIAYPEQSHSNLPKSTFVRTFRLKTPDQHARFLLFIATMKFDNPHPTVYSDPEMNVQSEFDYFYSVTIELLNQFYPERSITMSSRDPGHITPEIKFKLRRRNKLMRSGRIEEAEALSVRIGKDIMQHGKTRLCKIGGKADAKDMWAAVRQLTGRQQRISEIDGITAESLNDHYAAVSTDSNYCPPVRKPLATNTEYVPYITEFQVFNILDRLRPTATGLDGLPAWFLRLGAPVLYGPITRLFNLSLVHSKVPIQWKQASIIPVPKVSAPLVHADFRPISITSVLTRVMERTVVQQFLYPAFLSASMSLSLSDQFAFRPTGSTTAAIIRLISTITTMLLSNPFVVVISLDFSKAFDTVRHFTLLEKLAKLDLPVNVYNWLVDFFGGHSHCTKYQGLTSMLKFISASIIQGSAIGPATYVINASDLRTVDPDNKLVKFADDTYLVIPASSIDSRSDELKNVETWAMQNNLTLNKGKTKEIIFVDKRRRRLFDQPLELAEVVRVTTLKILGVTWTSGLSVSDHVSGIISSCSQSIYALKILRAHGMCDVALQAVYRSVIIAKLTYASSAWWGFATATDRQRIDGFLRRSQRYGFCSPGMPLFSELCESADDKLFKKIINNDHHLLHSLLPEISSAAQNYNLRTRHHNKQLPERSGHLSDSNFITRMLYKGMY